MTCWPTIFPTWGATAFTIPLVILLFIISLKLKPLPVASFAPSLINVFVKLDAISEPVKFLTCWPTIFPTWGATALIIPFVNLLDITPFKLSNIPLPIFTLISTKSFGLILVPLPLLKFLINLVKCFLALKCNLTSWFSKLLISDAFKVNTFSWWYFFIWDSFNLTVIILSDFGI